MAGRIARPFPFPHWWPQGKSTASRMKSTGGRSQLWIFPNEYRGMAFGTTDAVVTEKPMEADMSAITSQRANAQSDDDYFMVREAVAVFRSEQAFLAAVEALESAGFDRADISVLASESASSRGMTSVYGDARALEDDGNVPRSAFVAPESRAEAEAAAVGLPVYVGVVGGLFAAVASGGTLAFALPVAIAGGLAGGSIGAIGAYAISKRHRGTVEQQLQSGGILLWVRTRNDEKEGAALRILQQADGQDIHIHEVAIRWSEDEVPFAHVQPDPLLEKGPEYS